MLTLFNNDEAALAGWKTNSKDSTNFLITVTV